MSTTSRERQLRFMKGFGSDALRAGVLEAFYRNGPDWLTDEQMEEIVNNAIASWRFRERMNRISRKRYALRKKLASAVDTR